jgi:hypothetical protein
MAKEAKIADNVIETPQQEKTVNTAINKEPAKPSWEIKDRVYYLLGNKSPLTLKIPGRHTRKHSLLYFDQETGKQREIRYATNQDSPLVDEQKGEVTLGHIMFKEGSLTVPKQLQNLQKLLSIYHPLKNRIYAEFSAAEEASDELDVIELQIDALNAAKAMDIDQVEAIMRVSKELKRDLLIFAKNNSKLFIELANDENVQLRNVAIVAAESGVIKLSQDQRTFTWGSNGRKLMNVPFDENPYSAMAAWFKTDEGVEVYKSIEKKLL